MHASFLHHYGILTDIGISKRSSGIWLLHYVGRTIMSEVQKKGFVPCTMKHRTATKPNDAVLMRAMVAVPSEGNRPHAITIMESISRLIKLSNM